MELEKVFHTSLIERDKFLSRIFGIFSEKIVEIWCSDERPRRVYKNLGRPTIKELDKNEKGYTLDFTLKNIATGKTYATEMKCLLEYGGHQYLRLKSTEQLDRLFKNKKAFKMFRALSQDFSTYEVKVHKNGKIEKIAINGTVLIWGAVDPTLTDGICKQTGITEILSVEKIINDLINEKNHAYFKLLDKVSTWITYLTKNLKK